MARKSRRYPREETSAPKSVTYAAWGYARISIDGERSEDSIEGQTAIIKDYADSQADIDLRDVITDLGFTGTDFDRPGYAGLLEGIKRGDVQCVIVKDLSRVGRTYIEVGELLFDTLPAYNVRFISVNDRYDSFADDAARKKLLILFKNLVNHMYSKDLGKKIRSAHSAKKQRGELAGLPPYGYKRGGDGITLAFDGDATETVKRIFSLRLSGESANGIAKLLTREGVPSPQARRYRLGQIKHEKFSGRIVWTVGMVSKILQYETYTGTLVQGKYDCDGKRHTLLPKEMWIRHEGTHPAIIEREQFDAVQKLMRETAAKYKNRKNGPYPENKYGGKVICSRCGKVAVRCGGGAKERVRYYYCCRHCEYDIKAELGIKRIPKLTLEALDAAVMESLRKQLESLVDFDRLAGRLIDTEAQASRKTALNRERAKLEKAAVGAEKTLSAAYTHHLDGLLDEREFELVRRKAERDRREAEERLAGIEAELRKYGDMSDRHRHWRKIYDGFRTADAPTKAMVQALVSRIELTPISNELTISFNYADGLAEYRDLLCGSGVSADA